MSGTTLRTRLFASYGIVVVAGTGAVLLCTRLLAPRLFDDRIRGSGRGAGAGGPRDPIEHDAVVSALNTALLIGAAISLVVAAVAAMLVARRILRPIDDLRAATRRLAAGRYDEPVASPTEPGLAALADDINQLAEELAATEHRRASLIGDIAHEMRTPLTTITGYVDGFGDGLFTAHELVTAVSNETDRLGRLARDLASVSRAEEARLAVDRRHEDLVEILVHVTERVRARFDAKSVELLIQSPQRLDLLVDRERIIQAVTNLLDNALAYTPTGGTVVVAVASEAGGARISVRDSGIGIAAEHLDHIFERFYRVDPTGHVAGSGIGLTIARAIARAHGGDLTVASDGLGRGATFTLTLAGSPS